MHSSTVATRSDHRYVDLQNSKMLLSTNSYSVSFRARQCAFYQRDTTPCFLRQRLRSSQQLTRPRVQHVCLASAEVQSAGQQTAAAVPPNTPQPADNILYVTRLGREQTRDDLLILLSDLFKPYSGFQSVDVVQSPETGNFTGYAVFDTVEAASTARKALQNARLKGRLIAVGRHKRIGNTPSEQGTSSSGSSDSSDPRKERRKQQIQKDKTKSIAQQPQVNTVYVSNLAWATMSEDLQQHFCNCEGFEDAFIALEKGGSRPSGHGFVRFTSEAAAAAAVQAMHQTELDGRTLRVELARSGRYDSGSAGDQPSGLAGATATETRVFVGQVPSGWTYREVFGMCSLFGEVRKVKLYHRVKKANGAEEAAAAAEEAEQCEQDGVLQDGDAAAADEFEESTGSGGKKQPKPSAAIVFMADRPAAERVVAQLHDREVQGKRLMVNLFREKQNK